MQAALSDELRRRLDDERRRVAELTRLLRDAYAKAEELQHSLDEKEKRCIGLENELERVKATIAARGPLHQTGNDRANGGQGGMNAGMQAPAERCFTIPDDFAVFDAMPLPVNLMDWHAERKAMLWGNTSTCEIFGKKTSEEVRQIDMKSASEQVNRFQEEIYQTVQVQHKFHGPTRRMIPLPTGSKTFDCCVAPIRLKNPDGAAPWNGALCYFLPVREDPAAQVYAKFMMERVASMAMLFAKEDGVLVYQNEASALHFAAVLGGEARGAEMTIRQVLESFEWEEESEMEVTLSKINDLSIGEGCVVIERVVRSSDGRSQAAATRGGEEQHTQHAAAAAALNGKVGSGGEEQWVQLKFFASLDPTPAKAQRGAILVSGEEVSAQRRWQGDLLRLKRQQERVFAEMAHELRTPLHCIAGLSEGLLHDAACPLSLQKHLSIIHAQVRACYAEASPCRAESEGRGLRRGEG